MQVCEGLPQRKRVFTYECGLFISPEDSFLALTPDRACYVSKEKDPWGIVQVKCPYTTRNKNPSEAAASVNNFMSKVKVRNRNFDTQTSTQALFSSPGSDGSKWS